MSRPSSLSQGAPYFRGRDPAVPGPSRGGEFASICSGPLASLSARDRLLRIPVVDSPGKRRVQRLQPLVELEESRPFSLISSSRSPLAHCCRATATIAGARHRWRPFPGGRGLLESRRWLRDRTVAYRASARMPHFIDGGAGQGLAQARARPAQGGRARRGRGAKPDVGLLRIVSTGRPRGTTPARKQHCDL